MKKLTLICFYMQNMQHSSIKSVNIVSYDTDVLVKGVAVYGEALDHIWKRQ